MPLPFIGKASYFLIKMSSNKTWGGEWWCFYKVKESLELVTKEAEGLSCSGMDGVSGGVAWDSVLSWIVFPQIHILPRTSEYDLITQRAGGHVKTEAEIGVW